MPGRLEHESGRDRDMIVRRAVYADLPAIHVAFGHLVVELEKYRLVNYPGHDQQTVEDFTVHLAGRVQTDPRLLLYVALEDESHVLLGFLGGEIAERVIGHPTRFGAAHWLYVAPSARGRGVARALVRLACADLAAAGITHVELASLSGDDQWLRRGWAPFLVHYVLPLSAVAVAAAAERPAEPEPEPEPAPPPPAMAPRRGSRPGRSAGSAESLGGGRRRLQGRSHAHSAARAARRPGRARPHARAAHDGA